MEIISNKQTHIKGLIGELEFASYLIRKGWTVFTPLDQNSRIDMIIEKGGNLMKIQVKYCKPYKGCLRVDLQHRLRKTLPFTKDELNGVGIYDPVNEKFYLLPYNKIYPRQGIWLRVEKSGNKQSQGIHWAKDFEI
jgi:hypothetical protein